MALCFTGAAAAQVVLALLGLLLLHDDDVPWLWVVPFVVGGVMLGLWISGVMFERAVKRETAAGYTTLRLGGRNLDEIDPRTGAVLRHAGEPRIPRQARRHRLERVRRGELI